MVAFKSPAMILGEFGIEEPAQLDLEKIATYCGATVVYAPLDSCEAYLVSNEQHAIISIRQEAPRAQQRFSIGHELGNRSDNVNVCWPDSFVSGWAFAT